MRIETRPDPAFGALVALCPLVPIRDVGSYQTAIAVLDRLFDRGNQHPGERRYFHTLARQARVFERRRLRGGAAR